MTMDEVKPHKSRYIYIDKGLPLSSPPLDAQLHIVSLLGGDADEVASCQERSSPLLLIHWTLTEDAQLLAPSFYWQEERRLKKLAVTQEEEGYSIVLEGAFAKSLAASVKVYSSCQLFYKQPAWLKQLPKGQHSLFVPACGVYAGQCFDGWGAHILADGLIASLIPPGSPWRLRLAVPFSEQEGYGYRWDEVAANMPTNGEIARQCLVSAIRSHPLLGKHRLIELHSFSCQEAIALLLLRQAFPKRPFRLCHPLAFKDWPREWKHYANCLNLQAAPGGDSSFALAGIKVLIPKHLYQDLFQTLNVMSNILAGFQPATLKDKT